MSAHPLSLWSSACCCILLGQGFNSGYIMPQGFRNTNNWPLQQHSGTSSLFQVGSAASSIASHCKRIVLLNSTACSMYIRQCRSCAGLSCSSMQLPNLHAAVWQTCTQMLAASDVVPTGNCVHAWYHAGMKNPGGVMPLPCVIAFRARPLACSTKLLDGRLAGQVKGLRFGCMLALKAFAWTMQCI